MALRFIEPMLPTLSQDAPEGDEWIHEIKYDGYRTQIVIYFDNVRVFTRNGHDWTDRYRPIADAASALETSSTIIDGEIVVMDKEGRSDFPALKSAIARRPQDLTFVAFDLLHLNGEDIRKQPLCDRREQLFELIGDYDYRRPFIFSDHIEESGPAFFKSVDELGLEGIVSKRKSSAYRSGYSKAWLKTKCFIEDEFWVIGIERTDGPSTALLAREHDSGFEYVGGAMVTLPDVQREVFWRSVEGLKTDKPPMLLAKRGPQWLRPAIKVKTRYLKGAGKLRHATLQGLVG